MPYNPGTQYRGDVYLSQIGGDLASGIEKFVEARKEAKAINTAIDTMGSMVKHLVDQETLPASFLEKYNQAANGTTSQKRAALESIGSLLKFADQASSMKAREQAMQNQAAQLGLAQQAEAREAGQYEAGKKFSRYLANDLQPRTLPAMPIPGVSGYGGQPGVPIARGVTLPAQTITPELDDATILRAASRAGLPIRPGDVGNLMRYGNGGMTEYQAGNLAARQAANDLAREKFELSSKTSGMKDSQLISTINQLRKASRDILTTPADRARYARELGFYTDVARSRGLEIPPDEEVTAATPTPTKPVAEAVPGIPLIPGRTQRTNNKTGKAEIWDGKEWK